jgi:Ca-activated chloride channel family protein
MVLAVLAWLLLVSAAARPQWLDPNQPMVVSGRDLMLAVDISPSMQIDDLRLDDQRRNRLEVLQDRADTFLQRRHGDRLGLILFGAQAYVQAPLTFDRDTVRQLLAEAEIGFAGNATAIGDTIGLAVKRLRDSANDDAVVILLTDGANNAGELEPLEAAELARLSGVRIHTIGIGADSLHIEGVFGRERINPSADLDEALLRQVAALTGGEYFRARDTADLDRIHAALDVLEPTPQAIDLPPRQELYPWPLAAALLLGLVVVVLGRR